MKGRGKERSSLERLGFSLEWETTLGHIFSLPPLRKKCGGQREMSGPSTKFILPSQVGTVLFRELDARKRIQRMKCKIESSGWGLLPEIAGPLLLLSFLT